MPEATEGARKVFLRFALRNSSEENTNPDANAKKTLPRSRNKDAGGDGFSFRVFGDFYIVKKCPKEQLLIKGTRVAFMILLCFIFILGYLLEQRWANRGSGATGGPMDHLIRPTKAKLKRVVSLIG